MSRVLALVLAAVAAAVAIPLTAGAAAPTRSKPFRFTDRIVGAQISNTQAVFKVTDSRVGHGAGVQTVKVNGLSGTDTDVTYYRGGSARSHGSFTLGPPNAKGVSKLTGKGRDTGGTGRLRGFHSTYTYSGTFNVNTGRFRVTLKGKGTVLKR